MEQLHSWIQQITGLPLAGQNKVFASIVIIFVLWALRAITIRLVWRRTDEPKTRYRWQKSTIYIAAILGLALVSRVWFEGVSDITTYLGLVSAGIAIALKDPITSMVAWLFIMSRTPFSVGDRIQIGTYSGDVIDIRLFKFALLEIGNWVDADQSTGRILDVPNSMVFSDVLANYSKGFQFIWNEVPVLITFESNWQNAKNILLEIANRNAENISKVAERKIKKASRRFMIFYTSLTPTVYTSVKDSGVMLTIRYLIEPRARRGSEQSIWEDILRTFAGQDDIDLAYPTQRFYNNISEGKPYNISHPKNSPKL